MCGLGGSYLGGVFRGDREGKIEDRGNKRGDLRGNWDSRSYGEIGGGDTEAVDGVGNVVGGLDHTVGVKVLVGACGYSICVASLCARRWTTSMSK
jgi:hypothetical protein